MGFWDQWFGSPKSENEPSVEMVEAPKIAEEAAPTADEPTDAAAQYELADRYRFGKGMPEDHKKAFRFYKKSAEQGFAKAYFMLGNCYHFGIGTEQNYEMAAQWFRRGAEQGIAEAQHNLADAYETGSGVKKDMKQALYWYKKAAEQGIKRSVLKTALFYIDGIGGEGVNLRLAEAVFKEFSATPKDETENQFWQELEKKLDYLREHTETPSESAFGMNLAAVRIWLQNQQAEIEEANGGKKDAGY